MTEYVTTADALFFHKELIAQYGGASGIRDVGALESALHRPQTRYYETIVHEAAALFESLIKNHPLADGNKRVAFRVTEQGRRQDLVPLSRARSSSRDGARNARCCGAISRSRRRRAARRGSRSRH